MTATCLKMKQPETIRSGTPKAQSGTRKPPDGTFQRDISAEQRSVEAAAFGLRDIRDMGGVGGGSSSNDSEKKTIQTRGNCAECPSAQRDISGGTLSGTFQRPSVPASRSSAGPVTPIPPGAFRVRYEMAADDGATEVGVQIDGVIPFLPVAGMRISPAKGADYFDVASVVWHAAEPGQIVVWLVDSTYGREHRPALDYLLRQGFSISEDDLV